MIVIESERIRLEGVVSLSGPSYCHKTETITLIKSYQVVAYVILCNFREATSPHRIMLCTQLFTDILLKCFSS